MKTNFTKIFMIVVIMIFSYGLYSQFFPPPENVQATSGGLLTIRQPTASSIS